MAGRGDRVPVSALPNDGTYPTGTTQFGKRNLASEVPVWDPAVCIQCGRCVLVCPHAVIRAKVYPQGGAEPVPEGWLEQAGKYFVHDRLSLRIRSCCDFLVR